MYNYVNLFEKPRFAGLLKIVLDRLCNYSPGPQV